jgi:gluconolactonase
MALSFETVAEGLGFPEGPVAMADGSLLFVEIEKQTLSRAGPGGRVEVVAQIPGGPNGAAIGPDGAAYVCNNGGVYSFVDYKPGVRIPGPRPSTHQGGSVQRVDLATGEVTLLYDSYNGKRLVAPDDLVFDAAGGFWFTDSAYQDDGAIVKGALYYATTDGKLIVKAATIPMPNGVGLSPDGVTVYVSDTLFGRLWAFDIIDAVKGLVKPGPLPPLTPGRVIATLPGFQWVDSLKVEAGGRVCVGTLFNGGITVFSPDGHTEHIEVPDLFITNLCFGGEDMQDVFITASSTGRILKTRWPRPGLRLAFNA